MNFRPLSLKTSAFTWTAALLALTHGSTAGFAHPGHDASMMLAPENPAHWLVEPGHLAGWLGVGLALWALHRWRDQRKQSAKSFAQATARFLQSMNTPATSWFSGRAAALRPLALQHGPALGIFLFLLIGIPLLSAVNPAFQVNIWGKYLCYAALAVSLNWLWGYTGILCLCQSLFFALGGYAMGMYLMLMIGKLGAVQKRSAGLHGVPGLQSCCRPSGSLFTALGFAGLMVDSWCRVCWLMCSAGWLSAHASRAFTSPFLSQALTYAATLLFFRNASVMGGNNGFTDFRFILGMDIRSRGTQILLYEGTVLFLAACLIFVAWVTRTKFGMIQQAVRDSENRVLFSGYATTAYKLFVFTVSAIMAGTGRGVLRAAGRHHQSQ